MTGWIGTATSIVGSFLVAFHLFTAGYIFFLVGAVCWLWIAYKTRNHSLAILNLFFTAANIIGLWNSL